MQPTWPNPAGSVAHSDEDGIPPSGRSERRFHGRYLDLPGRLTRSARKLHLHLPTRWPWAHEFLLALDRLRCVPFPT
jgi:hypothetical protein